MLETLGQLHVLAGDHGRRGQAVTDLLGEVRPGEDRDRALTEKRREALPGGRVEALREGEDRSVRRQSGNDLGKRAARHRDDD